MKNLSKLISIGMILAFLLTMVYRLKPHSSQAQMVETRFTAIPEWKHIQHEKSLLTFQKSCQKMLKQPRNQHIVYGDSIVEQKLWNKVCIAALQVKPVNHHSAQVFFETHFRPKYWVNTPQDLITGYYAPSIEGRLQPSSDFNYPIYATPDDLIFLNLKDFGKEFPNKRLYGKIVEQNFVAYEDRAAIYEGKIKNRASIIAWVKSPLDGLELEIQGSGIILTPEKSIVLNYASQNGHHYHAIGRSLIQEGKLKREDVTFNNIRKYLDEHPEEIHHFLIQNPSFVFFKVIKTFAFYGYQNIPLSPGYSMAVDPHFIPMGAPIFVSTILPDHKSFNRLMIAQDVGGAIKGPGRGDIYWGTGLKAKQLASDMKQPGQMWYLFPKAY
jgi:membrane-bound lytic murein transglycosylase A